MADNLNQDINILIGLELDKSNGAITKLEKQLAEIEKKLAEKGIQLNIGIDSKSVNGLGKATKGIAEMSEEAKKFQKLLDKINKGLSQLDNSKNGSNNSNIDKKIKQLKQLKNTYQEAIDKDKNYENVINKQTIALKENAIAQQRAREEAQKRAKVAQENINNIYNKGRIVSRKVVTDPDGQKRAIEQTFKDKNGLTNTIQSDGKGKPHTIIRKWSSSDFDKQQASMLKSVEKLYDGKNLPDKMINSVAEKIFNSKDLSTLNSITSELDKMKQLEKDIGVHVKEANQLMKAQQAAIEETYKIKAKIAKLEEASKARTDKMLQTSIGNSDKKLVSMASTGKINQNEYNQLDSELKEVRTLQDIVDLKAKINNLDKQRKLNSAFSGDRIGSIDINKTKIATLESRDFERALKATNKEIESMKFVESEVNRITGEWSIKVKAANSQTRQMSGVIDKTTGEIIRQTDAMKQNNAANKTFGELFFTAAKRFPIWMAVTTAFYGTTRALQDMSATIIQVDSQMTQLKRVMDEKTDFNSMLEASTKMATELGQTITGVNDAMIGFAKQGFNDSEVLDLTKAAIVASNVSDLKVEESMDAMTSAMVQFKLEASDAMSVVDKWNEVDNNFAISSKDIAEGISKAGSTAKTFGVTIDELIGNITAIGEATRESGDKVGNSLKTIYSRLGSPESAKVFQEIGVAVKDQNGEALKATDILESLSVRWDTLSAAQQQNIGVVVAGRYQLSRFLALMNNWKTSVDATNTSLNSSGSATRENSKYMESLEARVNRLKSTWQELSLTMGNAFLTDSLISAMKVLTLFMSAIGSITKSVGFLPPLFLVLGLALSGYSKKIIAIIAQNYAASTSTNVFAKSLGALGMSLKGVQGGLMGIASSVGIGLAFMAVGFAVEKLVEWISKYNNESENLKDINYENVRSLEELRNSLQDTSKRYEELKAKKDKSKEDENELIRIQQQLAEQYGVVSTSMDANGKMYSDNIVFIKERINSLNEEIEVQRKLNEEKLKAKDIESRESVKDGINDSKKQLEEIQKLEDKRREVLLTSSNKGIVQLSDDMKHDSKLNHSDPRFKFLDGKVDSSNSDNNDLIEKVLERYSERIAQAKEKMNSITADYQKEADIRASAFGGFSESKMREIDSRITDKTKRITDSERKFITDISKAMSLEDDNPDVIEGKLSTFIDDTMNSGLKTLVSQYDKAISDFNTVPSEEAKQKVEGFKQGIITSIDELVSNIQTKTPEAKKEIERLAELFKNNFKPNLSNRKLDFYVDMEALTKKAKEFKDELSPLDQALQAVEKHESLTGQQAMELVTHYDSLAGSISQTADGWTVEKGAVEKLREEKLKAYNESIDQETKTTKVMQEELQKRLSVYGTDFANIETLIGAKQSLANLQKVSSTTFDGVPTGEMSFMSPEFQKRASGIKDDVSIFKEYIKNLEKADTMKKLIEDKTFGAKKEKTKKESKDINQFVVNEFDNQIQSLDESIKNSELRMSSYTSTSKDYRDEIQSQIDLLKEKQTLSHTEADRLRGSNVDLKNQISAMGNFNSLSDDAKDKYNDLAKEIDDNNKSIRQLSTSWLDFESAIQGKSFEKITSDLDNMTTSIEELDDKLSRSKSVQGTLDNGTVEFRNQTKEQIELLKQKQEQAHIVAEKIRDDMASGGLNDNDREKLEKRLKDLSNSWWDYENEIVSANKSLKQQANDVADNTIELYKDMYKEQKDLALEAIDDQKKKLEDAHDERIKQIEDETKAFEKSVQTQIDAIDKLSGDTKYKQELDQKQKDREKLQQQLDRISLSSDNADKLKAKDLAEEIAKSDLDIENLKQDHKDETRKDELQKQLDQYKEQKDLEKENVEYEIEIDGKKYKDKYDNLKDFLDKEKDATGKHYDGLINDEKKFQQIRQEIVAGTFDLTKSEFGDFKKYLEDNATQLGNTLQTSLLDKIKAIKEELAVVDNTSFANIDSGSSSSSSNSSGGSGATSYYQAKNSGETSMMDQMKKNSNEWNNTNDETRRQQLENANESMGRMLGASKMYGTWYKDGLPLYHEGGVVGKSSSNLSDLVNNLFNVGSNEQAIKALVGEVMIPEKNIASNFIPTMSRFASMVGGTSATNNAYNLNINIEKVEKGSEEKVISTLIKGYKKLGGK